MKDESYKDFVLDQLRGLEAVTCRRMFGGYGLYRGPVFFGIIHDDRLYFKTDSSTCVPYQQQGMEPFKPNEKQTLKNYYEVPADIVENHEAITIWAEEAVGVGKGK